ncbi:DoxX family protein [Roseomonas sp. OT10]|uniref:DoxX family protein n=1 Tax=Roseomonas cutis TaxID=2897332 RepID=UPI001E5EE350|nr:DoxX family protein [Roseomonas sp. OT10]UFN50903.1 DoxX family protein [Roseomonas sp. OT10]
MSALASRLQPFAPYALALLRIAAALIFLLHGAQKILGWPAPPSSGMPPVLSLYWIGGIMELAGGVLLVLGLFTRPVAFLLAGEMAYAYWFMHAPRSVYPLLNGGDAAILYCFVFFYLVFAGPGAWALDNRRR